MSLGGHDTCHRYVWNRYEYPWQRLRANASGWLSGRASSALGQTKLQRLASDLSALPVGAGAAPTPHYVTV